MALAGLIVSFFLSGNLDWHPLSRNVVVTGSASKLQVDVIGASHAALTDFIVGDAAVTAIGASTAEVEVHGTLDINVSGVSTLVYGDNPKLGKVEVSGISTLRRR